MTYVKLHKIILDEFDKYFTLKTNEQIKSNPKCERCKEEKPKSILKVFRDNFRPINSVQDILHALTRRQKERMLYKKSNDVYSLNFKDIFVQRIQNQFSNEPAHILCKKCFFLHKHEFEWKILINPTSHKSEIKYILMNITKQGNPNEIQSLCELLDPHISNRSRKIPRYIRQIWMLFPRISRKLYEHKLSQPFVLTWMKRWMDFFSADNFISSQIGAKIAKSIYLINDKNLNKQFFPILFNSNINLFRFFRINSENGENQNIITYILGEQTNSAVLNEKLFSSIEGIVASGNISQILQLLNSFASFNKSIQRLILSEIFQYCFRKNFSKLIQKLDLILLDKSIDGNKIIFSEDISNLYFTLSSKYLISKEVKETQLQEKTILIKQEKKRIELLHNQWKHKTVISKQKISNYTTKIIQDIYNPIIKSHIDKYRDEFLTFFKTHHTKVIAFDNEEWHNRVFCILGVLIQTDLSFSIKLFSVEDIYPINNSHHSLMEKMSTWLKSFSSLQVISHGTNQGEEQIIKDGGHFQINTQDILHAAKNYKVKYAHNLSGEGLKHFEKFVNFTRKGCPMLKHNMSGDTFFNLSEVSLDSILSETNFPTCEMCKKEQDVLLYCLEDAFASLLIYVYFSNHEPTLCRELGYELLI